MTQQEYKKYRHLTKPIYKVTIECFNDDVEDELKTIQELLKFVQECKNNNVPYELTKENICESFFTFTVHKCESYEECKQRRQKEEEYKQVQERLLFNQLKEKYGCDV